MRISLNSDAPLGAFHAAAEYSKSIGLLTDDGTNWEASFVREGIAIGLRDLKRGKPFTWFTPEFLKHDNHMVVAPVCIWHRDGVKITQHFREDSAYGVERGWAGLDRIWILTDEYDRLGYRLGVWPD